MSCKPFFLSLMFLSMKQQIRHVCFYLLLFCSVYTMLNHKIGGWGKLEKDACWIHNNFFSSLHYWAANAAQIQPFLGSISVLFFLLCRSKKPRWYIIRCVGCSLSWWLVGYHWWCPPFSTVTVRFLCIFLIGKNSWWSTKLYCE